LIKDKQLRDQMGAHGKPKAMQYDWPVLARKVLDFYTATLDNIKRNNAAPATGTTDVSATSGKH
jgi:hypothetical protein